MQLWGKTNKVMANLMGSGEMSLFIRVSISGRNGQPSYTGCHRKGDRGRWEPRGLLPALPVTGFWEVGVGWGGDRVMACILVLG